MDAEDLRLAVYRTFAGTGRAPDARELAGKFGVEVAEVAAGLDELARGRHLALGDRGQIVMDGRLDRRPPGSKTRFSHSGTGGARSILHGCRDHAAGAT